MRSSARNRIIFQAILAISWFWFVGATYLAQFPVYARDVLGGNVDVITMLLATFSIGILAGSVLCERMSHGRVEIGLVPFGANALVAFYIFRQVPEFFMRLLIWMLIHTVYRVETRGLNNIPKRGAAIITPNHVSFVKVYGAACSVARAGQRSSNFPGE